MTRKFRETVLAGNLTAAAALPQHECEICGHHKPRVFLRTLTFDPVRVKYGRWLHMTCRRVPVPGVTIHPMAKGARS
jgi:hypothetical protein